MVICSKSVAAAVKESGARLAGLSALMTTTLGAMEDTVRLLKKEAPHVKLMCGGAVLSQQAADHMGADAYAADAFEALQYARKVYGKS